MGAETQLSVNHSKPVLRIRIYYYADPDPRGLRLKKKNCTKKTKYFKMTLKNH